MTAISGVPGAETPGQPAWYPCPNGCTTETEHRYAHKASEPASMPLRNPLRYYRDRRGMVVHRSYCARVGMSSVPWNYADDMNADDIQRTIAGTPWLRACQVCHPDTFDYAEAGRSMDQGEPGIEGCVGCLRCRAGDHSTCHGCGCRCGGDYGGDRCPESCAFGGVRNQRLAAMPS